MISFSSIITLSIILTVFLKEVSATEVAEANEEFERQESRNDALGRPDSGKLYVQGFISGHRRGFELGYQRGFSEGFKKAFDRSSLGVPLDFVQATSFSDAVEELRQADASELDFVPSEGILKDLSKVANSKISDFKRPDESESSLRRPLNRPLKEDISKGTDDTSGLDGGQQQPAKLFNKDQNQPFSNFEGRPGRGSKNQNQHNFQDNSKTPRAEDEVKKFQSDTKVLKKESESDRKEVDDIRGRPIEKARSEISKEFRGESKLDFEQDKSQSSGFKRRPDRVRGANSQSNSFRDEPKTSREKNGLQKDGKTSEKKARKEFDTSKEQSIGPFEEVSTGSDDITRVEVEQSKLFDKKQSQSDPDHEKRPNRVREDFGKPNEQGNLFSDNSKVVKERGELKTFQSDAKFPEKEARKKLDNGRDQSSGLFRDDKSREELKVDVEQEQSQSTSGFQSRPDKVGDKSKGLNNQNNSFQDGSNTSTERDELDKFQSDIKISKEESRNERKKVDEIGPLRDEAFRFKKSGENFKETDDESSVNVKQVKLLDNESDQSVTSFKSNSDRFKDDRRGPNVEANSKDFKEEGEVEEIRKEVKNSEKNDQKEVESNLNSSSGSQDESARSSNSGTNLGAISNLDQVEKTLVGLKNSVDKSEDNLRDLIDGASNIFNKKDEPKVAENNFKFEDFKQVKSEKVVSEESEPRTETSAKPNIVTPFVNRAVPKKGRTADRQKFNTLKRRIRTTINDILTSQAVIDEADSERLPETGNFKDLANLLAADLKEITPLIRLGVVKGPIFAARDLIDEILEPLVRLRAAVNPTEGVAIQVLKAILPELKQLLPLLRRIVPTTQIGVKKIVEGLNSSRLNL